MKIYRLFLLSAVALTLPCFGAEMPHTDRTRGLVRELLSKLDSTDVYAARKEKAIAAVKAGLPGNTDAERYELYYDIADEYANYRLDSGLVYLDKAIRVACETGCDSLRMYELFIGPPQQDSAWDERGIDGVFRFLVRFWKMVNENLDRDVKETEELVRLRHQLIHTITSRLQSFQLNTVVSGFMEFNNKFVELTQKDGVDKETLKVFVQLMAPFVPHLAEELWERLGEKESVFASVWPVADEEAMQENTREIAVQVNGKARTVISIAVDADKDTVIAQAKEALGAKLTGTVVKEIYVPGKIVNIVVKP